MIRDSLILKGFHPDPSVIRVGSTFYVANSTFEWFPGVVISESDDLINWKFTTYVLNDEESLPLAGVLNGGGVWAPCLSYDGEYYYVIFAITKTFDDFTQDTDNYLVKAKDIHGPWSRPVYLNSGGFDASLFHDEDGRKYYVNMIWYEYPEANHFQGIEMHELDTDTLKLKDKGRIIFKGTDRGMVEGPHLYHINGYYYLLTAEGGTSEEHCVTMARSRDIWGPYEVYEKGPVLTAHNHPELNIHYAGHGDLIDDEYGNWYLFHLGSRRKLFKGYSVFGRETFMQNIVWSADGWPELPEGNLPSDTVRIPVITAGNAAGNTAGKAEPGCDRAVTGRNPEKNETDNVNEFYKRYDFSAGVLSSDFMSRRRPLGSRMSFTDRPGYLRLYGRESLSSEFEQSLLAVRICECSFTAETSVEFYPDDMRQRAGLIFLYHSANYYYIAVCCDEENGRRYLQVFKRGLKKTRALLNTRLYLSDRESVKLFGHFDPDGITFGYSDGGNEEIILPIPKEECPVTIMSDEYANVCAEQGFTGGFAGICTQDLTGNLKEADFAYFEIKR